MEDSTFSPLWKRGMKGDFTVRLRRIKRLNFDGLVKSILDRHPGESRGPEHLEITGFRLSPE
ncbi:MAG: hypothetical protein A2Z51_06570 [Deltaproteobacteria bacterium RBG_19FT_COMBO_52_11]|nr:MAG: hypothetical protein A2Z51_06570 [Deltaproteobacteria bacterium RBG_19FT_COMBO_52_11]